MSPIDRVRRLICGRKQRTYAAIRYHAPGTPEQNTERLLRLVAQDFVLVRERTDNNCQLFGRFMSVALLIERKLVRLLFSFDEQIDEKMFGQKIEVYKDFLKAFDWGNSNLEIEDFRGLIGPIKEIKNIRDLMAHDLSKVSISYSEVKQTVGYIRKRRPDLYETFASAECENLMSFGAVAAFAFIFSDQLALIQCEIL